MKTAGFLILASVLAQAESPDLRTFLAQNLGFSSREIRAIERDVVVKQLAVEMRAREVAIIGIVRIGVPPGVIVRHFRRIERFMENDALRQIGTFQDPPVPGDVASFRLDPSDLKAIQECEVGKCKVKLPARKIDRFRKVDWSAANAGDEVAAVFREGMIEYVRGYLDRGNSALVVYGDKEKPMAVSAGFDRLLGQTRYIYRYVPELHRYLNEFPRSAPPGVEDFLYWSVEDYGYRPVTAITHATIYSRPGAEAQVLMAQKQIYASHYFHVRFELIGLVDGSRGEEPGTYLVYLGRSLFDADLGGLQRRLLVRGVLKSVRSRLASIRDRLEAQHHASPQRK